MSDLEARLLEAHATGARDALITLYAEAAVGVAGTAAEPFYLTHAYVYALEAGSSRAAALRRRLEDLGSEPAER
jgi:hypothetical protein